MFPIISVGIINVLVLDFDCTLTTIHYSNQKISRVPAEKRARPANVEIPKKNYFGEDERLQVLVNFIKQLSSLPNTLLCILSNGIQTDILNCLDSSPLAGSFAADRVFAKKNSWSPEIKKAEIIWHFLERYNVVYIDDDPIEHDKLITKLTAIENTDQKFTGILPGSNKKYAFCKGLEMGGSGMNIRDMERFQILVQSLLS
jgi:hypothetical protein